MRGELRSCRAYVGLVGVVYERRARRVVTAHEIECPGVNAFLYGVLLGIKEKLDRAGFGKVANRGYGGGDGWRR